MLKRYSCLNLKCPRRYKVRTAERRQEVVERCLVGDVDSGEAEGHLLVLTTKKIIGAHTEIKQVARHDARRVRIVILSSIGRNTYP